MSKKKKRRLALFLRYIYPRVKLFNMSNKLAHCINCAFRTSGAEERCSDFGCVKSAVKKLCKCLFTIRFYLLLNRQAFVGICRFLCIGDKKDIFRSFDIELNPSVQVTPKAWISSMRSVVYHQACGNPKNSRTRFGEPLLRLG